MAIGRKIFRQRKSGLRYPFFDTVSVNCEPPSVTKSSLSPMTRQSIPSSQKRTTSRSMKSSLLIASNFSSPFVFFRSIFTLEIVLKIPLCRERRAESAHEKADPGSSALSIIYSGKTHFNIVMTLFYGFCRKKNVESSRKPSVLSFDKIRTFKRAFFATSFPFRHKPDCDLSSL